ncbi:MAG: FGGY family carbohydrate kinase [Tepidisphaeraceae bacterium]|jgi:xylulokinase
MKYVIGVDIGTQGTKTRLFDERGRRLGSGFIGSKLHRPQAGVVEEDPQDQLQSVRHALRSCISQAGVRKEDVAAVGLAGQMAGIIGIGPDGRHVTPYDSWLDTRCANQIHQMERRAGPQILARTGCAPSFNHGPKVLWWQQTRPSAWKRIAVFVQPGGYVAMRLCGLPARDAFIDNTYLHFSGFADNVRQRWDEDLCRRFKVPIGKLPRIVAPTSVVGQMRGKEARACGLKEGTLLAAGCGDTAASFLACRANQVGIGVDVVGTASVFATTVATFAADMKYRVLGCGRSVAPGLWHPYAYIHGGGMNLEWFRKEIASQPEFDDLNRRAAAIRAGGALPMFLPHLGGRACPNQPAMRGAWVGLEWGHTLGHLYRAVLEAVALEYAIYQRIVLELFGPGGLRELRITGGGEKSELWNQIKADVLQMPVRRLAASEGAPAGAALVAGAAAGLWNDPGKKADEWVKLGPTVKPTRELAKWTTRRRERYEALLEQLR